MGNDQASAPRSWRRALLRLPIFLYRIHLGWLLNRRFLLLTHIGRISGRRRRTVLEVVRYDRARRLCIVASGWGEQSQWYKNILANPEVTVTLGMQTHQARAHRLEQASAEPEFREYARKHPWAIKALTRFVLQAPSRGHDEDFALFAERIPLVKLRLVENHTSAFRSR